jgi:hypothetical protein
MRQSETEDVVENKSRNGNGVRRYGKFKSKRSKQYRVAVQTGSSRARKKLKLITRDGLDNRSSAARQFNAIVLRVTADLGGADNVSEVEKHLVTAFAGAAILQGHQLAKMLNGDAIDIHEFSSLTTAMIRSATRLGTERRAREVPTLRQYLDAKAEAAE